MKKLNNKNYDENYKVLEQQKLRDDSVLNSLQQANERGVKCKYSEDQIVAAQKQSGKKGINLIYDKDINPVVNAVIYVIYTLTALIIMPISHVYNNNNTNEKITAWIALVAVILMLLILIVSHVIKQNVMRDTKKERPWTDWFDNFSNDTYVCGYVVTSLGYFVNDLVHGGMFWFIYILMGVWLFIPLCYDLIKPFIKYLREKNIKSK